jgi:periplasmic protein TonB
LSDSQFVTDEIVDVPVTQQTPPPIKLQQPQIVEVPNTTTIEKDIVVDMDVEQTPTEVVQNTQAVQVEIEEEDPNTLFTVVEESASPVGGINAFNQFVAQNIVFPRQARRMAIEGKVYVEFVVERDGSITNVRTLKGIGAGCDEEAVRVVSIAPKWYPGKQRGKPVRQKMILPINFSTN